MVSASLHHGTEAAFQSLLVPPSLWKRPTICHTYLPLEVGFLGLLQQSATNQIACHDRKVVLEGRSLKYNVRRTPLSLKDLEENLFPAFLMASGGWKSVVFLSL